MFYFLGSFVFFGLFIVFLILVLGISFLVNLVGGIKNLWNLVTGKRYSANYNKSNNSYYEDKSQQQYTTSDNQGNRPHSKGVFGDDEGTYVDFEEVKEPK